MDFQHLLRGRVALFAGATGVRTVFYLCRRQLAGYRIALVFRASLEFKTVLEPLDRSFRGQKALACGDGNRLGWRGRFADLAGTAPESGPRRQNFYVNGLPVGHP